MFRRLWSSIFEMVDQNQGGMPITLAIVNLKASDSPHNITRSNTMQDEERAKTTHVLQLTCD